MYLELFSVHHDGQVSYMYFLHNIAQLWTPKNAFSHKRLIETPTRLQHQRRLSNAHTQPRQLIPNMRQLQAHDHAGLLPHLSKRQKITVVRHYIQYLESTVNTRGEGELHAFITSHASVYR